MKHIQHTRVWQWAAGLTAAGLLLAGCGTKNWSPTDPRYDTKDFNNPQVVEHWQIDIHADTQ